jgi:glycogen operon protein
LSQVLREQKHAWHGVKLNQPDWSSFSHSIALGGQLKIERTLAYIIFNAYWEALEFELPILREDTENWRRWIDTALDRQHEISEWNTEKPVLGTTYSAGARSVVLLIAGEGPMAGISNEGQSKPFSRQESASAISFERAGSRIK